MIVIVFDNSRLLGGYGDRIIGLIKTFPIKMVDSFQFVN